MRQESQGVLGTLVDNTERKRAEDQLRASEERFRTFFDRASDAYFVLDAQGRVVDVNRQACESLGWSHEELIGMQPVDFDVALDQPAIDRIAERARAGEILTFDTRHRRKNGSTFPVEIRTGRFKQRGELFYLSLARDITERKHAETERLKLEERLREAEKMEAIGRFASGIAHDFSNILGGVLAYGEMLFDEAPEGTPRKQYAQNVLTAATRGRDLVDQILAYTRSQRGKRAPFDTCRTVAEALELVRSSLSARVTLYPAIPDTPLIVIGDGTKLHQVVMNLCSNAIHAMQAGGPLRVAVTPMKRNAERTLSHGTLRAGSYVCISVEDSGCGMNEQILEHIFEPFFTTKEFGRGTGLGLALVYAIMTSFEGAIDVKSVPDEGSTFSIYLPLAEVTATVAA